MRCNIRFSCQLIYQVRLLAEFKLHSAICTVLSKHGSCFCLPINHTSVWVFPIWPTKVMRLYSIATCSYLDNLKISLRSIMFNLSSGYTVNSLTDRKRAASLYFVDLCCYLDNLKISLRSIMFNYQVSVPYKERKRWSGKTGLGRKPREEIGKGE